MEGKEGRRENLDKYGMGYEHQPSQGEWTEHGGFTKGSKGYGGSEVIGHGGREYSPGSGSRGSFGEVEGLVVDREAKVVMVLALN